MPDIHPTALLGSNSHIGRNVKIGPYSVIEDNVIIGDDTTILDHVHIGQRTTIGCNNLIYTGAVIGQEAQHKAVEKNVGFLKIGDHNVFREYATIHRGSEEKSSTAIGDHNYFMVFSHVGHDCRIANHVVLTNSVLLGGYVALEDHSILSGGSAVHQFCRIGSYAMIGGHASITKDVPPYMLVDDGQDLIGSMNIIGMRRAGFLEEAKRDIKNAYKLLYLSGLNLTHAMEAIVAKCHTKEVATLIEFMKNSKRGILGHRRQHAV